MTSTTPRPNDKIEIHTKENYNDQILYIKQSWLGKGAHNLIKKKKKHAYHITEKRFILALLLMNTTFKLKELELMSSPNAEL